MRTTSTKLAAITAVAALAIAGGACAADDGGTSPGQEAPAGDTGAGTDTGLEGGTGTGTDTGTGLEGGTGTDTGTTP